MTSMVELERALTQAAEIPIHPLSQQLTEHLAAGNAHEIDLENLLPWVQTSVYKTFKPWKRFAPCMPLPIAAAGVSINGFSNTPFLAVGESQPFLYYRGEEQQFFENPPFQLMASVKAFEKLYPDSMKFMKGAQVRALVVEGNQEAGNPDWLLPVAKLMTEVCRQNTRFENIFMLYFPNFEQYLSDPNSLFAMKVMMQNSRHVGVQIIGEINRPPSDEYGLVPYQQNANELAITTREIGVSHIPIYDSASFNAARPNSTINGNLYLPTMNEWLKSF